MKAWHFVDKTLRDGSPIPNDGEWLKYEGEIELCASGYHASKRVIDAVNYAPGHTLCRVEVGGEILEGDDKVVASERKIIWRLDAEPLLFEASRMFALSVADKWDMPDVVRKWLETGDRELKSAAESAARSAAESAAWLAAWSAARSAARSAAWSAARSAAESAARSAARSAAGLAAWSAARSAARSAAGLAAWSAAWSAAESAQEEILLELIEKYRD